MANKLNIKFAHGKQFIRIGLYGGWVILGSWALPPVLGGSRHNGIGGKRPARCVCREVRASRRANTSYSGAITPPYQKETVVATAIIPNIMETLRKAITLKGASENARQVAEDFFRLLAERGTAIKNASALEIEKEIAPTWATTFGSVPSGLGTLIRAFGEFALLSNEGSATTQPFGAYLSAFDIITRCDSTKVAKVLATSKTQKSAYNAFVHLSRPVVAVTALSTEEASKALQVKALATTKGNASVMSSVQVEVLAGRLTDDGKAYLAAAVANGKVAAMLLAHTA